MHNPNNMMIACEVPTSLVLNGAENSSLEKHNQNTRSGDFPNFILVSAGYLANGGQITCAFSTTIPSMILVVIFFAMISCYSYQPGSKVLILGMVVEPLIGNPSNRYKNPYYWVDDHLQLQGTNGSLDPSTYNLIPPFEPLAPRREHSNVCRSGRTRLGCEKQEDMEICKIIATHDPGESWCTCRVIVYM